MLTLNLFKAADAAAVIKATMEANKARGVQEIGDRCCRRRRPRPRRQRRPRAGAAAGDQGGRDDLQELCFDVPRRGRPRRADGRRAGRDDAGAAARRLAARAGPPRLRHQDAAARPDRPARRQDLHAGDGADGRAERRVDRRHRLVRPQQFRQSGAFVTPAEVARVRAADDRPQGHLDAARARGDAAGAVLRSRRGRRRRATTPAGAGRPDAAPGRAGRRRRACGSRSNCRKRSRSRNCSSSRGAGRRGRTWQQPNAAPSPAGGAAAAPAPPAPPGFPRQYQVEVSLDGKDWGQAPVAQAGREAALTVALKLIRIRATRTEADAPPWMIQNLRMYTSTSSTGAPVRQFECADNILAPGGDHQWSGYRLKSNAQSPPPGA